jgi:hypothetical protein
MDKVDISNLPPFNNTNFPAIANNGIVLADQKTAETGMTEFRKGHDGLPKHGYGVKTADIPALAAVGAVIGQNTRNGHCLPAALR